mgnify:CR=1 FL=1
MKIICDWENCKDLGKYKAPIEKDNSRKYRLLCLKHIKIFNKNWNYFENMNDHEIEYFLKSLKFELLKMFNLSSRALFHKILKKFSDDPKVLVDLCQVKSDLIKNSISSSFIFSK